MFSELLTTNSNNRVNNCTLSLVPMQRKLQRVVGTTCLPLSPYQLRLLLLAVAMGFGIMAIALSLNS